MSGERMTADNSADRQQIDAADQQFVPVDLAELDEVTNASQVVARPFNPEDYASVIDSNGNKVFKNVKVKKTTGGYL